MLLEDLSSELTALDAVAEVQPHHGLSGASEPCRPVVEEKGLGDRTTNI